MFCNCNEWESHSFDELSDVLLQSLPKLPTLLHCCIHCSVTNVCKQSKYYMEYDVLPTTFSCLLTFCIMFGYWEYQVDIYNVHKS